jgi:hypothetical protein
MGGRTETMAKRMREKFGPWLWIETPRGDAPHAPVGAGYDVLGPWRNIQGFSRADMDLAQAMHPAEGLAALGFVLACPDAIDLSGDPRGDGSATDGLGLAAEVPVAKA